MQFAELFDIRSHQMELNDLLKKTQGDPEAVCTAGGQKVFFRLGILARG